MIAFAQLFRRPCRRRWSDLKRALALLRHQDVEVYLGKTRVAGSVKGQGIFAGQAFKRFSHGAIEEEGRLTNFRIREHFLTKLYANYRFRQVEQSGTMAALVKFQASHKYLLMAYSQKEQKALGGLIANHEKLAANRVISSYIKRDLAKAV